MFVRESLTDPNSLFAQIVHIIEEGGWTVFRNMPLIFAVGLPIGLAKQAQGRACLAVMVSFLTWNYFINAMGIDRKSTRLNSSHVSISYAVFCLKKKKKNNTKRD